MVASILKWAFVQLNRRNLGRRFYSGEQPLKGLKKPVKIYRDKWAVSHIYSENLQDLFAAQGYIHARDRFWQMEMNRRIATGTLAEVFGKMALPTDQLTRTLGFSRISQADLDLLDDEFRGYLEAYAQGVNAWLKSAKLPVEFLLAGFKPREWEPIHSLAWGRVMAWTLSHGWTGALLRSEIVARVGEEMAEELKIKYPADSPVELPDGLEFRYLEDSDVIRAAKGPFLGKDMEGGGRGSNAWAVSGSRTGTGAPMLANDTHLTLSQPGVWYINHLHSKDGFHVTGASLPGIPACMIGHNDNIAWGITLAFTDCEDIFIEKTDPANPAKYEYKGQSKKFRVVREVIPVKGEKDHVEEVRLSVHGPMISDVTRHSGKGIALCSMALYPNQMLKGFFGMCSARNWREFSEAVWWIEAPQLNIVYADIRGNIGMRISGLVPVRNKGLGDVPVPGWTGEYDWIGSIPFGDMPAALNPRQGYIISTNNKPVSDDYPHYLGNSFMNGYRARRIDEVFRLTEKISVETMQKLHMDVNSIPGRLFVDGLIKGFRTARPKTQKMIDVLMGWDGELTAETIGGTAYQVALYTMLRNLVEPHLGRELTHRYMGMGEHALLLPTSELLGHSTVALFDIFQNPKSHWIHNSREAIDLIDRSLEDACNWLEKNMGYEPENWKWGDIHQVVFHHALSVKKPLDQVFDSDPVPMRGDTDTVHQAAFNPSAPYHSTEWSPSFRMIVDLSDLSKTMMICPPGQVGVLGSPHYEDQIVPWNNGKYIHMLWHRKDVEKQAVHVLELNPVI